MYLGRQNLEGANPNEVSRGVSEIILHPGIEDIALVRLDSPVTFTRHVRPVCLAANNSVFYSGTESWITGWGTVDQGGESKDRMEWD